MRAPSETSLANNDTAHLIADIERLREHLGIERWLVLGGSWGCTLALAYAEVHPEHVSELVLFGITTGRREEFEWLFRGGVARLFPEQWERLCAALPLDERQGDIVKAFAARLNASDHDTRRRAAEAWCLWESATPAWPPATGLAPRFADAGYALAFARIVTHYVVHDGWIGDDRLLRNADSARGNPRRADQRPLRLPSAHRERVGAPPGVAFRGTHHRGRCGPRGEQRWNHARDRARNRSLRASRMMAAERQACNPALRQEIPARTH